MSESLEREFLNGLLYISEADAQAAKTFMFGTVVAQDDFSKFEHYIAYSAIKKLVSEGVSPNGEAFFHETKKLGSESPMALMAAITSAPAYVSNLDGLWKKVSEEADRRRTIADLRRALGQLESYDSSPMELRSALGAKLLKGKSALVAKPLTDYVCRAMDIMHENMNGVRSPVISTGIPKLDAVIGGWQDTLTLIGALPGTGKSGLLAATVYEMAKKGTKVAIFSLEDEPTWLAWRFTARESGVDQKRLRFSRLSESEMNSVGDAMSGGFHMACENVIVVDGSSRGLTLQDITASCHDLVQNHGVKAIFIDHLGEIPTFASERHDREIGAHLSALRKITNEYHVPIVLFAHTKRPGDNRAKDENGRPLPKLSDFAESAYIERMARVAIILDRDLGSDTLIVNVLKQTNGPAGQQVELKFDGLAAMAIAVEGGMNVRRFFNNSIPAVTK